MTALLAYGSLALAAANITVTLTTGRGHRAGWIPAACMQVPWTACDVVTHQFGFPAITAAATPACLREWRKTRHGKEPGGRRPARR